ncbi:sugar transferase [Erysipelothrix sp. HDW6C]|uniref:sugar transferase n=1 Tax=Erysipelothrix sp. HDW6C TaxID=2714930 RepID=UPI001407C10C|nr:sugar transferase [Erysipelothrix sp. HDW6C]QIK70039.1 sugar transferase [Erysipelothrix sp. HDW6C]
MNKKNNIKAILLFTLKMFVYTILLCIFVIGFGYRYPGLKILSRTFVITSATFLITTFLMTNVYGTLDIGGKKSKPILYSMVLNVFITDLVTYIALKIMGYHDMTTLGGDLLFLFGIFVLQFIFIKVTISLANNIFFKFSQPEKTVVIQNNSRHLEKMMHFLNRHTKQYEVIHTVKQEDIDTINFGSVERVILLDVDNEYFLKYIERCYLLDINIMFNAGLNDVLKKPKASFVIDDILMFEISGQKITIVQAFVKRFIDIAVSAIALLLLSPLMLIIALCVKLNDGGPVFYSQGRLTKDGKIFEVYKFRSMKVDSGDKPVSVDDDRITKVGKFIRKFRIDELPQLINIIKGDMSIVGPRPESVYMTENIIKIVPQFGFRLKVKGGLTGYAQIFGKYNTHPLDKLLLDIEYIENFSIMNDFKLMLQTLIVFVKKDSTEAFEESVDQ